MKSSKTTGGRKNVKESLSFLIENELEKAEVVLAAKSVVDKLSKMIETLATLEGEEIMPMFDAMKLSFGADTATNFQKTVGETLRTATQNVMQAKDAITSEVSKLENAITGEGGDIASLNLDAEMEEPANDDLDVTDMDDVDMEMDDEAPIAPTPEVDPFDDEGSNAAGRARNKSARPKGRALNETQRKLIRTLRESKNPDALLYATFRRQVKEGHTPIEAAKRVSAGFGIDIADIFAIVKDRLREGYEHIVLNTLQGAGIRNAYFKDGDLYVDSSDKDRVEKELKKNYSILKMPNIVTEAKKKGKKEVPNCVPVKEDANVGVNIEHARAVEPQVGNWLSAAFKAASRGDDRTRAAAANVIGFIGANAHRPEHWPRDLKNEAAAERMLDQLASNAGVENVHHLGQGVAGHLIDAVTILAYRHAQAAKKPVVAETEMDDKDMEAADKLADRMRNRPNQTKDTVRSEVEKMAGSVGKQPKDADKIAPLVQAKLDGMGKLKEGKKGK